MQQAQQPSGSASRWGPLFGAHALAWAETWEGPEGWGTPVYEYLLDRGQIGPGSMVLDCGCGAGRFARMAADAGATVAGIDAAQALLDIAADRTPEGDFRVGDLEVLPWPDRSFDVVTGFSTFQFADDKTRALTEAGRVSRGLVAAVIPTRAAESGIAAVFKPLFRLFPPDALQSMKHSGMFALSEPGALDDVLAAATLNVDADEEIDCPIAFDDTTTAARAFIGAGPMQLAIQHSGEQAIAEAVRDALVPFTGADGHVLVPATYRVVLVRPQDPKA
ncbi:MAG: class I SAM-dependent methyltransferase [Actinomycetota bacterium]|nr:class I SAM-dependent methyltransferase [Actinomycetota bacterium]